MSNAVLTIAKNTLLELRHRRAFMILGIIYVIGFLAPLFLQTQLNTLFSNPGESQSGVIIFLTKFSINCGMVVCVFYASSLIEIETTKRTITAVMTRPIERWEYLAGRALGVITLFLIFIVAGLALAYLCALITKSALPFTFSLGVIQRLGRGIEFIFIVAALGMLFSATNAMLLFIFYSFIVFIFLVMPKDLHWSLDTAAMIFHYLTPASLSFDLIEGMSGVDQKSFWISVIIIFENVLFGIMVFTFGSWIFAKKDLQLREE